MSKRRLEFAGPEACQAKPKPKAVWPVAAMPCSICGLPCLTEIQPRELCKRRANAQAKKRGLSTQMEMFSLRRSLAESNPAQRFRDRRRAYARRGVLYAPPRPVRTGADGASARPDSLSTNFVALEKSAAFGGSSATVADSSPAVDRKFWWRSHFEQAANGLRQAADGAAGYAQCEAEQDGAVISNMEGEQSFLWQGNVSIVQAHNGQRYIPSAPKCRIKDKPGAARAFEWGERAARLPREPFPAVLA